jgi:hypothetical protein
VTKVVQLLIIVVHVHPISLLSTQGRTSIFNRHRDGRDAPRYGSKMRTSSPLTNSPRYLWWNRPPNKCKNVLDHGIDFGRDADEPVSTASGSRPTPELWRINSLRRRQSCEQINTDSIRNDTATDSLGSILAVLNPVLSATRPVPSTVSSTTLIAPGLPC